jgi:sirohydrochlorin ferrochelatase
MSVLGIVVVDHGSRRAEANDAFLALVERFATQSGFAIVEPAHMELASPTLDDAFARAVARGATEIVVHPCFLLPGRHWNEDIPRLCDAASRAHGGVAWRMTGPLGDSPQLLDAIRQCIDDVLP